MRRHELLDAMVADQTYSSQEDVESGKTVAQSMICQCGVLDCQTGAPWRDLPDRFGPWNSVFQGTTVGASEVYGGFFWTIGATWTRRSCCLDSTIVRAHQHAAGEKGATSQTIGRSRGD